MWPAAHSYWSFAFGEMSVRDATHRSSNHARVPRASGRSPDAVALEAAARAARCDGNVPICRGRTRPVSVSMPSTRTVHLSRCLRTVGSPVGFHPIRHLRLLPLDSADTHSIPVHGFRYIPDTLALETAEAPACARASGSYHRCSAGIFAWRVRRDSNPQPSDP